MKNFTLIKVLLLLTILFVGCTREDMDDDVLSQEDISNIILLVKDDESGNTQSYNYTMNSAVNPEIHLQNGKSYTVSTVFMNGNEDETASIIEAKDEHFLLFDFQNSNIQLERIDDSESIRTDGHRLGLKTKWHAVQTKTGQDAKLVLTLIHGAISVSEAKQGSVYGTTHGGETDATAIYTLGDR